jgi:DNA-directed RNA polymerase specialized sigma24 family protein
MVLVVDIELIPGSPGRGSSGTSALVAATYDRHQRELFSFALRASRDSHGAEVIVEDAFAGLIAESDADRFPANIRAWLFHTVANAVTARGRLADPTAGSGYPALDQDADLERALGELAVDERTVLLMAAAGFMGIEIAQATGKGAAATRNALVDARLRLRRRLDAIGAGR